MNKTLTLGLIGFGEAGFHLAKGLSASGTTPIHAYDIHADTPGYGEKIRMRALDSQVVLVSSPSELANAADLLISVVTASSAYDACIQTTPFLGPHHIYADLNSISPRLKQSIAEKVLETNAQFVEGAIMAPVPPNGHRVPILVNGPSSKAFIDLLSPFGMRLEQIEGETGSATAVKMCRSIVVKGMEALLFECVMAAEPYGAAERVFRSLGETFPGIQWSDLASYMMSRVVVHGERRAAEMHEVARTLEGNGIEPRMSEATAKFQAWVAGLDMRSHFGPEGPADYRQVIQVLRRRAESSGR